MNLASPPSTLPATAPSADDEAEQAFQGELDPRHELCEQWSRWVRTRRFYSPPSKPPSILGRLTSRTRASRGGPDAASSAELAALNAAIEAEPIDAIDRQVFELHYRHRVSPVKAFADALGISRRHWYNLLRAFEERVHVASLEHLQRMERDRLALGQPVQLDDAP